MVTVFLSSVAQGLQQYRDAAYKAIEGLDGHHCVRMEDFGARSGTAYSVCLAKVSECDLFIGLVGHEYGSIAPNTEKSYSEAEYDAAVAAGKPTLVLMAPEEFPVPAKLIETDQVRQKQINFRTKVSAQHVAFFSGQSTEGLARQVIQAIHNRRSEGLKEGAIIQGPTITKLLFPLFTNQAGMDTGIAISNISADPFGTEPVAGSCTIHYYGHITGGFSAPGAQTSGVIRPGEQLIFTSSNGGNGLIAATPGFQGYLIVECRFKAAGTGFVCDLGLQRFGSCYTAQML